MDERVKRGLIKWPNVPAVYGWLALDRRGNWLLRNELIQHPLLREFINRNYEVDDQGCYFLQNGPQKSYVTLELMPWVYLIDAKAETLALKTHTEQPVKQIHEAYIDSEGAVILVTEFGPGNLDDREFITALPAFSDGAGIPLDDETLLNNIEQLMNGEAVPIFFNLGEQRVAVKPIKTEMLASQFGFEPSPKAAT